MSKRKKILLTCLLAWFICVEARAEIICLKSGRTIEARIVEENNDSIRVDFLGVILTFYRDDIKEIRTAGVPGGIVFLEKVTPPAKGKSLPRDASSQIPSLQGPARGETKAVSPASGPAGPLSVSPQPSSDLAIRILSLCKEYDQRVDVDGLLGWIEETVTGVAKILSEAQTPQDRIALFNRFFFTELGFSPLEHSGPMRQEELINELPSKVLESHKGGPRGLSYVYLMCGQRLNLPLYGVLCPQHMFVRYDDGKTRFNIETQEKGQAHPDSFYRERFWLTPLEKSAEKARREDWDAKDDFPPQANPPLGEMPSSAPAMGIYLKNLTPSELEANFFIFIGNLYLVESDLEKAGLFFRRASQINPDFPSLHNSLGAIFLAREDWDGALNEFKKELQINPRDITSYSNMGSVYLTQGKIDAAISSYTTALEIDPLSALEHYLLGRAYEMKEDHGQAWKEFREAERLGYAVPAQEWDTVAFKNPRIAERFGAAQQNPQNAAAHFALASTYFEEGLFRLAEAEFIKTLELEPKMAGAHFGLGSVYLEMHLLNLDPQLLEKARVKIEEALHIDPNLAEAHYALGYIYILTHDMVKAIEEHRILKGLDSKLANLLLEELEPSRTHSAILEESARQVHKELFRPLGEDAWGFSTAD